ncbi:hypothetical protein IE53DRAFT_389238 [Violaceomyces palustris]|uniref:Uncharacterized protein n=1 Tax=Violaceomyces palustris TaxID=1673888 RepID=A0ACD0NRX0_9BASI|nr:hypothetical protein IE53DRAFT_389238 [Violaceomyces palustris]
MRGTIQKRSEEVLVSALREKYKELGLVNVDRGQEGLLEDVRRGSNVEVGSGVGEEEGEEGKRRLPKTPDNKPWAAVFVRPSHLGGVGGDGLQGKPSIYYGKNLYGKGDEVGRGEHGRSPTSLMASRGGSRETKEKIPGRRLSEVGMKGFRVDEDDPKSMRRFREGMEKYDRVFKLRSASEGVRAYVLGNRKVAGGEEGDLGTKAEGDGSGSGTTKSTTTGSLGGSSPKGWASLVDERIESARKAGFFENNKLRGKPLKLDYQEMNPFLNREEFFMNRIVKKQGASPPWVELNSELESETMDFRKRLMDQWVRRASRMILSGPSRDGLQPLKRLRLSEAGGGEEEGDRGSREEVFETTQTSPRDQLGEAQRQPYREETPEGFQIPTSFGEIRTVEVARSYRDREWIERERAYHSLEIDRLNQKIRKYNHLAPFSVRKGLLDRERFLDQVLNDSFPLLVSALSESLTHQSRVGSVPQHGSVSPGGGSVTNERRRGIDVDFWGRPIQGSADVPNGKRDRLNGWLGNGFKDRGETSSSSESHPQAPIRDEQGGRTSSSARTRPSKPEGQGLILTIRRTIEWAKGRVGL